MMFRKWILSIFAKGLGTQYRDVSENEISRLGLTCILFFAFVF